MQVRRVGKALIVVQANSDVFAKTRAGTLSSLQTYLLLNLKRLCSLKTT